MSAGRPIPIQQAEPIAVELREALRSACHRVEIAGSIRRRKPFVADIEIVAMPIVQQQSAGELWGATVGVNLVTGPTGILQQLAADQLLWPRLVEIKRANGSVDHQTKLGDSYLALVYRDLPVDLFLVRDHDSWGLIFALRTGPRDWNTRLVTDCKRFMRRVEGGRLYDFGSPVPTPEEVDFFAAIGQPWIEPAERHVSKVHIQQRVEATA